MTTDCCDSTRFRSWASCRLSISGLILASGGLLGPVATAAENRSRSSHASIAAASDCRTIAIYEYTGFCNGPVDVNLFPDRHAAELTLSLKVKVHFLDNQRSVK
jgi:hypothetical protein